MAGTITWEQLRELAAFRAQHGCAVSLYVGLDPSIGPVVTDSAYADGYTVVSEVGTNYTGLPSWFTPGITITARVFFGLDVWSVRPADIVRAHQLGAQSAVGL